MDSFETEQGQEDVEGNGDPVFIKVHFQLLTIN